MAAALTKLASWDEIPALSLKRVMFTVANTADATDTLEIVLADYGISETGLLAVSGWVHTTDGSVILPETVTSSVTTGTLTITIPAGTDNDFRVFEIIGRATPGVFV